jgi:hypothetical protein
MNHASFVSARRLAGLLLVAAVAFSLAACGRADNIVVPKVTGPVGWDNTVRHLLADRSRGTAPTGCTSCHHAGTGIPDWSDYDTVVSEGPSIRSRLDVNGNMRQFLDPGEPEIVIAWIDAGFPR